MELSQDNIKQINKMLWEEKAIVLEVEKGKNYAHVKKNKRFNSWVFSGSKAKSLLKQFITFNDEYKKISQIQNFQGYRQFIPFKSWTDCWNIYKTTGFNHRYLYELIISENPCKPYLDIEWETENGYTEDNTIFLDKLRKDLIKIFKTRYKLQIKEEHILITKAPKQNKTSYHVTINCIIKNKYIAFATNRCDMDNSAWDLYVALVESDNEYLKKIDKSVYSRDREMRTIYSTKFGEIRHFLPLNQSLSDRTICENALDYFITHFDDKYEIKIIETPKIIKFIPKNIKSYETGNYVKNFKYALDDGDEKILNRIYELLQYIHPTAHYTGKSGEGWRFEYTDKTELCYTGHTHKRNGFIVYIKPTNGFIYMYCYSTKCGRLYKLGHLYYDYSWKIEGTHVNTQFLEYKQDIKIDNLFDQEDYKFTGLINKFVDDAGCYIIKSGMGTGKTQFLKKLIESKFASKRIIYLSHRQTFTSNIYGTFKELGFHNYMVKTDRLFEYDKIIIQIDSLTHLLKEEDNTIKSFDFVIIDEIESILNHLSSPTLETKRDVVCMILEIFIKNAKWVLGMDADFGNRAYDFITQIREKPKCIINTFVNNKRRFMFNENFELRMHQIIEDIKNKKNIVIISLSKNMIDTIYEKILAYKKKIKIIRYTSMTDDKDKKELEDVNNIWINYRVVMYSPSVEAGVDFNVKSYFNRIYCFLNNGSCSPRSLLQMIGRIRYPTDDNIRCCYDKTIYTNKNKYIPTLDEIENIMVHNDALVNNKTYVHKHDNVYEIITKKTAFTKLMAHNYLENYEKQIHFMSILKELIREKEWDYVNENAGKIETIEESQEDNKTSIISTHENTPPEIDMDAKIETTSKGTTCNTVELDELLESPFINDKEAKELEIKKNKNMLTRNDKLSLKKYWIIKKFKLKKEDFNLEFLINWYNKEHILDNAMYAMGKKEINNTNDVYLNNIKQQIKYLNIILKIFGFNHLFDTETIIERDNQIEKKMENSKLLEWENYQKIMTFFGKKSKKKENSGFNYSSFVKLSDIILNNFGMTLECIKKLIRESGQRKYVTKYKLTEQRKGIKTVCINE